MELAKHIATWSKDTSTKVGCVIVNKDNRLLSQGYNGFPTGVDDSIEHRYSRPYKYDFTEHSERNAIYNAARIGVSLVDTTMYSTLFPCVDCTRAIIQSGIVRLVTYRPDFTHHKYGESWKISLQMLGEVGVEVIYL